MITDNELNILLEQSKFDIKSSQEREYFLSALNTLLKELEPIIDIDILSYDLEVQDNIRVADLRYDFVRPSLSKKIIEQNAKNFKDDYFRVPEVLE